MSSNSTAIVASSNVLTGASRDFFSNISSDINGLADSTTNMFSNLFGSKKEHPKAVEGSDQRGKAKESTKSMFGPFNRGPKGLAEKSPLIKHMPRRQDDIQWKQAADKNATNSENQAFLKDVRNKTILVITILTYLGTCRLLPVSLKEKVLVGSNLTG